MPYKKYNKYFAAPLFDWDNFRFTFVGEISERTNYFSIFLVYLLAPLVFLNHFMKQDKYSEQRYF